MASMTLVVILAFLQQDSFSLENSSETGRSEPVFTYDGVTALAGKGRATAVIWNDFGAHCTTTSLSLKQRDTYLMDGGLLDEQLAG